MKNTLNLGKIGEDEAVRFLEKEGFKILERNFRTKFGEIDVIVLDKDKTLVFVEVKTMRVGELKPEDQMSPSKIQKFKKVSEFYANSHEELVDIKRGWRLDVLALEGAPSNFSMRHYRNI